MTYRFQELLIKYTAEFLTVVDIRRCIGWTKNNLLSSVEGSKVDRAKNNLL